MKRQSLRLAVLLICIWPLEGQANVGVPLFSNFVAYSWLLLIPIIAIEAYVLRKRLPVTIARASAVAGMANIASTILGTVVVLGTGLLLSFLDMTELPGAEGDLTVLIALVPCYFLSVWFETLVGSPLLKHFSREEVRAVFILANQFSYAMLAIVPIARFLKNLIVYGRIVW